MNLGSIPWWVESPDPDLYLRDDYLVIDFETSNLDKGSAINPNNHIVCGTWKFLGRTRTIVGNEYQFSDLIDDIEKASFVVCHNAKFELGWLSRCGLSTNKIIIYDTQIGEYVILGNRSGRLDLNSVSRSYGYRGKADVISRLMKLGICPSQMPRKWLIKYNEQDVDLTEGVFLKQRKILHETGLLPTQYTRCLFTPVLADIEFNGMFLDESRVIPIFRKMSQEHSEVLKELDELTGGINPKSPKQVAAFLYDELGFKELTRKGKPWRTAKDGRKTDIETVMKLEATTERQRLFKTLKKKQAYYDAKLTKALTKFYACLQDENEPGLLRAQFNQTVTQNHRLSSSGLKYKLQFQNFDREFKPVFKARTPGWKMGEMDQSMLEWRGAAFLSQDMEAINAIVGGDDVHGFTATKIFKEELENRFGQVPHFNEIKKLASDLRTDSKPHSFKPLYAGEYGTPEEMRYYKAFREKYPVLNETQEAWTFEVLATGKLVTATGLIFYWPGTKMDPRGQITNKRNIYNYPISEFAGGEIVPVGVICLWHRLKSLNAKTFIVNTIHDSVIAEVAPDEEELYSAVGKQSFIDDVYVYLYKNYGIDFNVPLEVEIDINENWHDSQSWQDKWIKPAKQG